MAIISIPGLIDPHVHLRDPGQIEKEDFFTGTQAALHGGFTTILDMPNNLHPITSEDRLMEKIAIAKEKVVCDIGLYYGSVGDNTSSFNDISRLVFGLKIFLNRTTGGFVIDDIGISAVYDAWPGDTPILVHAEEEKLEVVIDQVTRTGKKTHVCHVAGADELRKIIEAKEKGLPITCGVTPHHLFLTEHDAQALGPFGKVRPPLRTRSDVDFLWKHLEGIDIIESDHAPHAHEEKEQVQTPYGMPGLETTLPLLMTSVAKGRMTLENVVRMCHTNPSRIFNLTIDPTTIVEIDTTAEYILRNADLFTKCGWSPFDGWKMRGKITKVTIRGSLAMQNDTIVSAPGSGRVLSRV